MERIGGALTRDLDAHQFLGVLNRKHPGGCWVFGRRPITHALENCYTGSRAATHCSNSAYRQSHFRNKNQHSETESGARNKKGARYKASSEKTR